MAKTGIPPDGWMSLKLSMECSNIHNLHPITHILNQSLLRYGGACLYCI